CTVAIRRVVHNTRSKQSVSGVLSKEYGWEQSGSVGVIPGEPAAMIPSQKNPGRTGPRPSNPTPYLFLQLKTRSPVPLIWRTGAQSHYRKRWRGNIFSPSTNVFCELHIISITFKTLISST